MEAKQSPYRTITLVFAALAVLTVVEYIISQVAPSGVFLMIIALAKAGLIVQFFMHIYRLWRVEDGH